MLLSMSPTSDDAGTARPIICYDFRPQFVQPILVGLGKRSSPPPAKLQTIRRIRENRRHARPMDTVALYVKRHDYSELIGTAICTDSLPIKIFFDRFDHAFGSVRIDNRPTLANEDLHTFAQAEGFDSWLQMSSWFQTVYRDYALEPFIGVLIKWRSIIDEPGVDDKKAAA